MKKITIFLLSAVAANLFAIPFRVAVAAEFLAYELRCEQQYQTAELEDLTWSQGSTPLIAVRTYERGRAVAPREDTTVQMMIAPTATSQWWAVVSNQTTNATAYLVQWPTIGTNTTADAPWYYVVYFLRDGRRYWTGSGRLWIEETTATGDGLVWQEIVSADIEDMLERLEAVEGDVESLDDALNGDGGALDRLDAVEGDVDALREDYLPRAWTNDGSLARLQLGGGDYDKLEGELLATTWLTPSRFEWEAERSYDHTISETNNPLGQYSFATRSVVRATAQDWLLTARIIRNLREEALQVEVVAGDAELEEEAWCEWRLSFGGGAEVGDTATVHGRLGDWQEDVTVALESAGWVETQLWWRVYADHAVGAALQAVRGEWEAIPEMGLERFVDFWRSNGKRPGDFELMPNPNFWAAGMDLSGVSVWADRWYYTKPVTLVASNLAIGAAHWAPSIGTTVAFFGKDGELHFTRVVEQRNLAYDLSFSRLSPAIPPEVATAYPMLSGDDAYHCTLPPPGRIYGEPKAMILSCSQACTAWQMQAARFNGNSFITGPETFYVNGIPDGNGGWAPRSRASMVGGDSGHPQFVSTDGTNLVLVGCASTTAYCSWPGNARELVERASESLCGSNVVTWEEWPQFEHFTDVPKP